MAELDLKNYKNRHSLKSKIARVVWGVVRLLIFRWLPTGFLWSRYLRASVLRLFCAKMSKGASVHGSARVWQPWNLEMGCNSTIGDRVDCYAVDKVRIGAQVVVSQDVFLCTASHDITSAIMELTTAPIEIQDQAWIGARAVVLPGVTIGVGAVVAAGAVVTKNVEPWTVVGGNPAKFIKKRALKDGNAVKGE